VTAWALDVNSAPYPVTTLDVDWLQRTFVPGFAYGAERYDLPFTVELERFHGRLYEAGVPRESNGRSEELMLDAVASLSDLWAGVLPEVQSILAGWDGVPFDESVARARRMWELHFVIAFPELVALSVFEGLYRELFPEAEPLAATRLLAGAPTEASAADDALWQIAQLDEPDAPLEAWLDRHGARSDGLISVSVPSWREDRSLVEAALAALRAGPAPAEARARQAGLRDDAITDARSRLAAYPAAVRSRFDELLASAQVANVLHEDHHLWIDGPVTYHSRRAILAEGHRLGIGADVFHLTVDEILAGDGVHALVSARRGEPAEATPPATVGAHGDEGDSAPPDLVSAALSKTFAPAQAESAQAGTILGNAASPGIARGTVRVVRTLAESGRLAPGEILVTPVTTPPWTPVLARAGAVVTDAGGMLSHCAVVAREFGVPAVVGTRVATSQLEDGQLVEVDGARGTVVVLG